MKIIIEGDPIPAARPRFSGHGHCYQPKRNMEYRDRVQAAALVAMNGKAPMTGEISAVVKLYRRYKPSARNYGDADNLLKGILDGMNSIVFCDDSQVVRCVVEKYQDKENPRAEIIVSEVSQNDKKT